VIRRLEVIGEAVKRIPAEIKEQHPETPCRRITCEEHLDVRAHTL